jgi:hypothetical protein
MATKILKQTRRSARTRFGFTRSLSCWLAHPTPVETVAVHVGGGSEGEVGLFKGTKDLASLTKQGKEMQRQQQGRPAISPASAARCSRWAT